MNRYFLYFVSNVVYKYISKTLEINNNYNIIDFSFKYFLKLKKNKFIFI